MSYFSKGLYVIYDELVPITRQKKQKNILNCFPNFNWNILVIFHKLCEIGE